LTLEVTQAENWLLLTGFPFLVFFNFFAVSGIQENLEFNKSIKYTKNKDQVISRIT